jgi:ribosomal protein L3 glutamine methyltransferase
MQLLTAIRQAASTLQGAGLLFAHHADNALDEARELVLHALHLPDDFPSTLSSAKLLAHEIAAVDALIAERIATRKPAAYLIGRAKFAGFWFKSDARALVPRSPIAELLPDRVREELDLEPLAILDMCAGSGCIGIAAALHFANARVWLADISAEALSLANENIAQHHVGDRVRAVQSDGFGALRGERFDLILSNPPYLRDDEYPQMEAEYRHEPRLGLTSGADGLDLPLQILRDAPTYLHPDGWLVMEIGEAEFALKRRVPSLALDSEDAYWMPFQVGRMGVLAIRADRLRALQPELPKQ